MVQSMAAAAMISCCMCETVGLAKGIHGDADEKTGRSWVASGLLLGGSRLETREVTMTSTSIQGQLNSTMAWQVNSNMAWQVPVNSDACRCCGLTPVKQVAPAMNTYMWESPFTEQHLDRLKQLGVTVTEPVAKKLACGDIGAGAMAAPETIVAEVQAALCRQGLLSATSSAVASVEPREVDGSDS